MVKMTLRDALRDIRKNGTGQDFAATGLPMVSAVRKRTGRVYHRDEIDREWQSLFGLETNREPDDYQQ